MATGKYKIKLNIYIDGGGNYRKVSSIGFDEDAEKCHEETRLIAWLLQLVRLDYRLEMTVGYDAVARKLVKIDSVQLKNKNRVEPENFSFMLQVNMLNTNDPSRAFSEIMAKQIADYNKEKEEMIKAIQAEII